MVKTTTIDEALDASLAGQRKRLSAKTLRKYEDVVSLLRSSLNVYAYQFLTGLEEKRWRKAFDAGDEEAFTRLFGPKKVVENLGEFLGHFMVRKVRASQELLRAPRTERQRLEAVERGGDAARELPRVERLTELEDIPDEHWVEGSLAIERVEAGALWFEGGIGPVRVSKKASDLAEVGWNVNVVLAQLSGEWRIVELGFVYPEASSARGPRDRFAPARLDGPRSLTAAAGQRNFPSAGSWNSTVWGGSC
jgi:hypothetical protein